MKSKVNKAALLFGYISLSLLIGLMLLSLSSELMTARPNQTVTQWKDNQKDISIEYIGRQIDRVELAQIINPFNSSLDILLAELYSIKAETAESNDTDYQQAIKHLNRALEKSPKDSRYLAKMSELYSKIGNHELAVSALNESIANGPFERANHAITIPLVFKYHSEVGAKPELYSKVIKHVMKFHVHAQLAINEAKSNDKLEWLLLHTFHTAHKKQITKILEKRRNE